MENIQEQQLQEFVDDSDFSAEPGAVTYLLPEKLNNQTIICPKCCHVLEVRVPELDTHTER